MLICCQYCFLFSWIRTESSHNQDGDRDTNFDTLTCSTPGLSAYTCFSVYTCVQYCIGFRKVLRCGHDTSIDSMTEQLSCYLNFNLLLACVTSWSVRVKFMNCHGEHHELALEPLSSTSARYLANCTLDKLQACAYERLRARDTLWWKCDFVDDICWFPSVPSADMNTLSTWYHQQKGVFLTSHDILNGQFFQDNLSFGLFVNCHWRGSLFVRECEF